MCVSFKFLENDSEVIRTLTLLILKNLLFSTPYIVAGILFCMMMFLMSKSNYVHLQNLWKKNLYHQIKKVVFLLPALTDFSRL